MPNIIEITDLSAPELEIYTQLSEGQLLHYKEPDLGFFIAESPKVILRALEADYSPISALVARKEIKGEVLDILNLCGNIPIYTADYEVLSQLTGFHLTRGMLCAMQRKALPTVEEVVSGARRIAVLENVMNPTNVGAIFRSAAALNMDAVLLTPACSNPLYRRAIRVSMGTVFQIPWTFLEAEATENPPALSMGTNIKKLHNLGFETVAFALREDSISIDDSRLATAERLAIVLGTEGEGLADETISGCDYTVKIPMSHGVDSLNVAAASAVAFWQLGH